MKNNILWVFIHPIRSGGNTLIEFIKEKVPKEEYLLASVVRYQKNPEEINKDKIRFLLGHATYYGMHNLVPGKQPRYFIIVRDPAERVVDYYNAKMEMVDKKIPFDVWYKNQMKNDLVNFLDLKYSGSESTRVHTPKFFMPVIRRLNYKAFYFLQTLALKILKIKKEDERKKLENAKKLLELCWFVGVLEKSKEDFGFILKQMRFKNPKWGNDAAVKIKTIEINDKIRQKIYEENKLDVELYKYALELRKKKIKEITSKK